MHEFAVDGNDGAGKTTVASRVAELLTDEGHMVRVYAPFRLANQTYGQDIYPLWSDPDTAQLALKILGESFGQCQAEAKAAGADTILYDRGWMSVLTEFVEEIDLAEHGIPIVPAAYLRTNKEVSRARSANDHDQPWMEGDTFDHYHERFEDIARHHGAHLLGIYRSDDDVDVDALARNIVWDMQVRR